MGILYRTRQFWLALTKAPANDDLIQAAQALSPSQLALFQQMQPGEQAHSLAILQQLRRQGPVEPDLATAALLHDVGKSRYPLYLWERVLIVVFQTLLPEKARTWGQGKPAGWRRPFVVAEQHPEWGAQMAAEAGCGVRVVEIIRRHQQKTIASQGNDPLENLLLRLQASDNER